MSSPSTKKFVTSLNKKGELAGASEFLVPSPDGEHSLIGIKTGKVYNTGAVVFTGRSIDCLSIEEKLTFEYDDRYLSKIDQYISEINDFKVGNVISIELSKHDEFRLKLEAKSPVKPISKRIP